VWRYLTALLEDRPSATCVALAEGLRTVAQDGLTRLLPADWSGQSLLESAVRAWCGWERGALIRADPVVPTPFATALEGWAWVFSSPQGKPV
jgi:hypothetical protein